MLLYYYIAACAYRLRAPNLSHSRLVLFSNNGTRDGLTLHLDAVHCSGLDVSYRLEEGSKRLMFQERGTNDF